jgi:hypothetical protein
MTKRQVAIEFWRQSLFLRQHLPRLSTRFACGLVAEQRGGGGAEQARGRVDDLARDNSRGREPIRIRPPLIRSGGP